MKPIHIKQIHSANYSFSIEERVRPGFTVPYHFHNEYELTAILKGSGSRFIGNNISDFTDRDMVLVGKTCRITGIIMKMTMAVALKMQLNQLC